MKYTFIVNLFLLLEQLTNISWIGVSGNYLDSERTLHFLKATCVWCLELIIFLH